MTILEAIEMKRKNEERAKIAREKTWQEIEKVKDIQLRKELKAAYCPSVKSNRRSG